jgi:NitT/TauT family transport system permease protein
VVWTGRLGFLCIALLGWQYLPQSTALRERFPVFDPFFLSSPRAVALEIRELVVHGENEFWSSFWFTVRGSLLGFAIGLTCAVLVALLLANNRFLRDAGTPLLDLANAVPIVVIIPLVVLMFGPALGTSITISSVAVFFFTVFNAYGGGASMPVDMERNSTLLGAGTADAMWRLRLRYVIAWTMQILPGAVGYALVAAFAGEMFSGAPGMGALVAIAIVGVNANLVFATVLIVSFVGIVMNFVGYLVSARYLHWFGKGT